MRRGNYISYTDDITPTIYPLSSRANFIHLTTDRAIGIINQYWKTRKIKTIIDKFLVTPADRTNPRGQELWIMLTKGES